MTDKTDSRSREAGEREAFEQFLRDKKFPVLPVWQDYKPHQNYALEVMWDAWLARAELSASQPKSLTHEQREAIDSSALILENLGYLTSAEGLRSILFLTETTK